MREHVDSGKLTELARALVAVDTSNPPGTRRRLSDILRDALRPGARHGKEVEPAPGRLSLIARLPPRLTPARWNQPGRQPRAHRPPRLIVNGHTDVVPAVAAAGRTTPSTRPSRMTASTAEAAPT